MLFKRKQSVATLSSLRVTPAADDAAALERKFAALNYHPDNGFHRDLAQLRRTPRLRVVSTAR